MIDNRLCEALKYIVCQRQHAQRTNELANVSKSCDMMVKNKTGDQLQGMVRTLLNVVKH